MDTTNRNPGKTGLGSWDYPVTVLLLGVLSLAVLVWTDHLSQRQRVGHFSIETLQDLQVRAATSHLWLEEGLTDGVMDKLERASTDLTEAIRLSQLLVDGGEFAYGYILEPLRDPELRRRAEEITRLLSELRAIARERVEARVTSSRPSSSTTSAMSCAPRSPRSGRG